MFGQLKWVAQEGAVEQQWRCSTHLLPGAQSALLGAPRTAEDR